MVPPIGTTPITPENVKDLTDAEIDIVLNSEKTKERIKTNLMEKEREDSLYEHDFGNLLHKAFMTPIDKENMKKAIKFLIDKKMDTPENFGKLEAIYYEQNFIEIGGVKRGRENLKAEPNNKDIFKHGDEVYFMFDALEEQQKLLTAQGMEISGVDDFAKALQALPGNGSQKLSERDRYAGANILGIILDLPMSGLCERDGKLSTNGEYGFLWSSSAFSPESAWYFEFNKDEGILDCDPTYSSALPVRPVLK